MSTAVVTPIANVAATAAANASTALSEAGTALSAYFSALLTRAFEWPFGLLNPLHWSIIRGAVGFTPLNVLLYLAPITLMYAQFYLLLAPGTRYKRLALGGACIAGMWSNWRGIRFTKDPWHNAWNHVITMPYVQFMIKSIEFSFLNEHIRDPRGRPRWLAAYDLLINSRMIGLGNVGLDVSPGIPNAKVPAGYVERYLKTTLGPRPKSRFVSVVRHLAYSAACYTAIDFGFSLMRRLDPIFQQPYGGINVADTFASRTFTLSPGLLNIPVPKLVVFSSIQIAMGVVVWMTFEGLYQLFAAFHVAMGWPIDAWDPNMFGSPWKANSLINLWGKRWHQTFRHMFLVLATVILKAFRLPVTSTSLFFGTFFFSGAIHCISEMCMDPIGSPGKLMMFFVLAGAGCAAEVTIKRVAGKHVRGGWGQIWTLVYMTVIGRFVSGAWLDSGYAGCHFLPPGPGDLIAAVVAKYGMKVE